jgi:DNA-3-methyladenine glycosylase I
VPPDALPPVTPDALPPVTTDALAPVTRDGLMRGADGVVRCRWTGADAQYVAYHDTEWGRPVHDDVRLYEKLCLEGFQAGLSWITILRKRETFREVFYGFDPERVAAMTSADVDRLVLDARIIRHRGKIEATITNAQACITTVEDVGSLDALVWSYAETPPTPRRVSLTDTPSTTLASTALSKDLKRRGWRFVGPTTVYAFLQSMGVVDDHMAGCHVPVA